jgi:hypothetical protein
MICQGRGPNSSRPPCTKKNHLSEKPVFDQASDGAERIPWARRARTIRAPTLVNDFVSTNGGQHHPYDRGDMSSRTVCNERQQNSSMEKADASIRPDKTYYLIRGRGKIHPINIESAPYTSRVKEIRSRVLFNMWSTTE